MLYFDWAAAAPPEPESLKLLAALQEKSFANQESGHALGFALRQEMALAAESLSRSVWGHPGGKVIWGNSCTELFQLLSSSPLCSGRKVATSTLEHPSLIESLRRAGASLTVLKSAPDGKIIPEKNDKIKVVALHHVQSEIGVVQDLDEIFSNFPGAVRVVDAAQSAGKLPLPQADIIAVSGAKLGVPGGGAALLLNPECEWTSRLIAFADGYRKNEHRMGRVSPVLPTLLALAFKERLSAAEEAEKRVKKLNTLLRDALDSGEIFPTVDSGNSSPYILHFSMPGRQGAVIMRMLSEAGVMASAGSACAAESREPSPALLALGRKRSDAYGGLRLSFGWTTSPEEGNIFLEIWQQVLQNY